MVLTKSTDEVFLDYTDKKKKKPTLEINAILSAINKKIVKHCIQLLPNRNSSAAFNNVIPQPHKNEVKSVQVCKGKMAKEVSTMAGHKELTWHLPPAWQNFLEDVVL